MLHNTLILYALKHAQAAGGPYCCENSKNILLLISFFPDLSLVGWH